MIYNNGDKLHGEQSLAREILKIIPLIEKHFKPADGVRCTISTGSKSAKFSNICKAFNAECSALTKMRITVDTSGGYSAWLNMDIHEHPPSEGANCGHVNYFKYTTHLGQATDSDNFIYEFTGSELRAMCESILSITLEQLQDLKQEIDAHKNAVDKLASSVPYIFKELVNDKY